MPATPRSPGSFTRAALALAPVLTERLRARLPGRNAVTGDAGTVLPDLSRLRDFRADHAGGVIRVLRIDDEDAWLAARRANAARMDPWWAEEAAALTGRDFRRHYLSWAMMRRRGTGSAFVLEGLDGLAGEVDVFARHGGSAVEFGLWARPDGLPAAELLGLMGALVDELVLACGVQRIDAPVAVGNEQPVKLIRLGGFWEEGTLESWRPLGDRMVDIRMFGMTATRWPERRAVPRRLAAWRETEPARTALAGLQPAVRVPSTGAPCLGTETRTAL